MELRRVKIDRDATGHDAVASSGDGRSSRPRRAARVRAARRNAPCISAKRGVVADRADIAEVIGEPLHLRHQRAQPDGARRRPGHPARLRRRGRKRRRRRPCCRPRRGRPACAARSSVRPAHQRLRCPCGHSPAAPPGARRFRRWREAEMAGLDDAGMDGADRDLMQAVALGGQEGIGRAARRRPCGAQRWRRPHGRGPARAACRARRGVRPNRSRDGAFQTDRGRMDVPDARERFRRAGRARPR